MNDDIVDYGKRFGIILLVFVAILASAIFLFGVEPSRLSIIFDADLVAAAIRLTVPIGFAAMGGIFSEKTGVINIGLEGLLIVGAFTSIAVADWVIGLGMATQMGAWVGFVVAVIVTTAVAFGFAVACIRYRANHIIAGLAIWLIALGFAPFASRVLWQSVNSPSVASFNTWGIPILKDIPGIGSIFFDANPVVYMFFIAIPLSWILLNRTVLGDWIEASGENPEALDTAGINVYRIRYFGVIMSGVFSGIGGAGLAIGSVGSFIGLDQTIINGRGWIAITAYLIGNYTIPGAVGASFLFGSLDALQIRLQQIPAYMLPDQIIQVLPYIAVIAVITAIGKTRMPGAAGESYRSGEE